MDAGEVANILTESIRVHGVVRTWTWLAMPVLRALGERWNRCGEGIHLEHNFSEALLGVLRCQSSALATGQAAASTLLACAAGEQHTLPLQVLACALLERRIGCRLLGPGMPSAALVAAVRRTGPAAVVLYARMPAADLSALPQLHRQRPAPRLITAGEGWSPTSVPATVLHVRTLEQAIEGVRACLTG
jgi:hypothetical protein